MGPNKITCTLLREMQREARCQEKENSVKPWKQRLGDVVTSQKMPAATRAGRGKNSVSINLWMEYSPVDIMTLAL